MRLKPCIKGYKKNTHRAVSPEETLARIESKMPRIGITEITEITNLDRIGIPVFLSKRTGVGKGAASIYNGKGATPTEAKVSVMMEGIERYSAEIHDRSMMVESFSKLSKVENALDPKELILPKAFVNVEDVQIPWVEGYDLVGEEEIFVPANAVFHPLSTKYKLLFRTNTNGLASGNEIEEAIFHGLAEVIERDSWSLVEVSRNTGPNVSINDGVITDLLDKFSDAGVLVHIRDITSDIGIPTFAAASDDISSKDPTLLVIGMGTHTNVNIASIRAVTEVAQSRLTQIHGEKADKIDTMIKKRIGYERTRRMNAYWFETSESRDIGEIASSDNDDFLDDIRYTIGRLKSVGVDHVIATDLTRDEIGVPVVRVIVPGMEVYAMDPDRMGRRCINVRSNRITRA